MNKDLYIQLLEELVDDLSTAMKIDTVLTSRKIAYMKNLENQLASVSDWNKAQDELISKVSDTAMDYQAELNDLSNLTLDLAKDINDFAADWAADNSFLVEKHFELVKNINDLRADFATDHAKYRKTLETIKEQNTRECDLNVRLQGKIAELEKEKAQLAKKNQCLLEDIKAYGKALAVKEENK